MGGEAGGCGAFVSEKERVDVRVEREGLLLFVVVCCTVVISSTEEEVVSEEAGENGEWRDGS